MMTQEQLKLLTKSELKLFMINEIITDDAVYDFLRPIFTGENSNEYTNRILNSMTPEQREHFDAASKVISDNQQAAVDAAMSPEALVDDENPDQLTMDDVKGFNREGEC